jgi:hypothetical protein
VYDAVHRVLVALFEEDTYVDCVRAIVVGQHLCDRKFAGYLAGRLVTVQYDQVPLPQWLPEAVAFVGDILVPTDTRRTKVFELALSIPETRIQGWKMSRQEDAEALLPWIPTLLRDYPEETVAIGIKFALVWQGAVLGLAEVLRESQGINPATVTTLTETLEMYLLRVRRVRLWREFCRTLNPN